MFKALTLPSAKEKSCNKSTFDLSFERYENKDIDENVKLFLKNLFSTINILNSYYLCHCWFINRSSRSHMFYKMDVLENIAKFTKTAPVAGFPFYRIAVLLFAVCKFIKKETLAQLPFNEFSKIFKKTFLIEHRCFCKSLLLILRLTNLTIECKLRVVSYSWESELQVNAN